MTDTIIFKKDSKRLSRIKNDAKTVRNCFDSEVVSYLKQFPSESAEKFEFRKDKHISTFTNFVSSAINAMSGIALKKLPKVDDDDLASMPKLIGDALSNIGCDGVGYLFVDAPKLKSSSQKENQAAIDYISIDRVKGEPVKDMLGNIIEFVFEGDEEYLDDKGEIKARKYRKKIFIEDGKGCGEKYIEAATDRFIIDPDNGKWNYGFDGLPVIEIDILTANKHPYIDVADNNIGLYNIQSSHRNILHIICVPYHLFFGDVAADNSSDGKAQVFIGADRAWRFNDKTKDGVEIVEAKGTGVGSVEKEISAKIDLITRMTVSVLTNQNYKTATQAESAESKTLGFLPFVVMSVEESFNKAIEFMGLFRGKPYSGGVTMSKKFSTAEYNNAQLTYIKHLYDAGIITKSTMLDIAKEADLLRASIDNEKEIQTAEEQMGNVA